MLEKTRVKKKIKKENFHGHFIQNYHDYFFLCIEQAIIIDNTQAIPIQK